jgi:hypothetical protein
MKYQVTAENAYGKHAGDEVDLDYADPAVQLNVAAGVLKQLGTLGTMTCPACDAEGRKRPTKLADQAEVTTHYGEKHAGLVAPEWKEEVN